MVPNYIKMSCRRLVWSGMVPDYIIDVLIVGKSGVEWYLIILKCRDVG